MTRAQLIGSFALTALVLVGASNGVSAQEADSSIATAVCTACHRDKFDRLQSNPHSALESDAWRERIGASPACAACHGDVTEHIEASGGQGNAFAFRDEPVSEISDRCLGCHDDDHPSFDRSPHAQAGLSCVACHNQHGADVTAPALLKGAALPQEHVSAGPTSAICFDCHGDIFTQFSFNERHRLHENILSCTSCHDPHDAQSRQLLGGFKQQQCAGCHADKSGPFVFEHPASRVEGCTACHSPHGAPNRHLLTHQRVGELCLSCHATVPQFHLGFAPVGPPRFNLDTQCTNCHSSIHGSNFHPAFLR